MITAELLNYPNKFEPVNVVITISAKEDLDKLAALCNCGVFNQHIVGLKFIADALEIAGADRYKYKNMIDEKLKRSF